MMGWGSGWGMGGFFGVGYLLRLVLLVVGIAVVGRWLLRSGTTAGGSVEGHAMGILMERYARGEIDKAEFEARKRDLA
jgi:putative membrane protein